MPNIRNCELSKITHSKSNCCFFSNLSRKGSLLIHKFAICVDSFQYYKCNITAEFIRSSLESTCQKSFEKYLLFLSTNQVSATKHKLLHTIKKRIYIHKLP